ncbi:antibiotic ABC transporter ATP-binding protein, partial [Streptomyces sp. NPDC057705]
MARVVLVHGIAQQFEGPESLGLRLGAALRDGVKLSSGLTLEAGDVACAFYGNAFIEPGTRAWDLPRWNEHDVAEGLEADLLDAWFRRAVELEDSLPSLDEEGTRNLAVYAGSRVLLSKWVRARLNGLAKAKFFQPVAKRAL